MLIHIVDQKYVKKIIPSLLWTIPVGLALCLAPLMGSRVSPDGAGYLAQGLNFYLGKGYTYADGAQVAFRGPVFSFLLSLSFQIFGVSVLSAMILIRAFFVMTITLVYLWGRKISDHFTGMAAALFLLTSFSLHRWSARVHLDIVMPFFILAAVLALFYAFEKKRLWIFVSAAVLIGIAILTKEVAMLFIPLPSLLWLLTSEFRNKQNLSYLLIYYVIVGLLIAPWVYRLMQDEEVAATFLRTSEWILNSGTGVNVNSPASPLDNVEPSLSTKNMVTSTLLVISKPLTISADRLNGFYQNFLAEQFLLAPLFALAWLVTLLRAIIQRNKENILLLLSLFCFMPIVLFLGAVSYRAGQAYYVYTLSYIVLSYQLVTFIKWRRLSSVGYLIVLVGLLCAQIFVGDVRFSQLFTHQDGSGYVQNAQSYAFSYFRDGWTVSDWHAEFISQTGEWVQENTEPSDVILSDWQWLESYYFYAAGRQPIYEIEYFSNQLQRNPQQESHKPIYFIWTQAGRTDPNIPASNLLAFSETHFLAQVQKTEATHIIIGQRRNFLALYLHSHPNFVQVAEFGGGRTQIFKIIEPTKLQKIEDFPLFIGNSVYPYLNNVREQTSPQIYGSLIQTYFIETLGLQAAQVKQIEARELPEHRYNMIISHKRYASIIKQTDPDLLFRTIQTFEEQANLFSKNPWIEISLAHLYFVTEQNELARESFVQAIRLSAMQPDAYPAVVNAYKEMKKIMAELPGIESQLVEGLKMWVEDAPEDPHAYWQLAETYQFLEDSDNAADTYKQALVVWPESAATMLRLARLYSSLEQFEEAKLAYQEVLRLPADDQYLPSPADIHIEIGKIIIAQKKKGLN